MTMTKSSILGIGILGHMVLAFVQPNSPATSGAAVTGVNIGIDIGI